MRCKPNRPLRVAVVHVDQLLRFPDQEFLAAARKILVIETEAANQAVLTRLASIAARRRRPRGRA